MESKGLPNFLNARKFESDLKFTLLDEFETKGTAIAKSILEAFSKTIMRSL